MDRRSFIKNVALTASSFLVFLDMTGCGSIIRSDLGCIDKKDRLINILGFDKTDILCQASLAPSSHNVQPWTVKITEPGKWMIGTERARWIPAVDPNGREMMISLGTFLQTLIIAAAGHGYKATYKIIGSSPNDTDIIELSLEKSNNVEADFNSIKQRTTVRKGIENTCIRQEDIKYIFSNENGFYDAGEQVQNKTAQNTDYHYFTRQSAQGKFLEEGTLEANKYQVKRDDVQMELGKWKRWSHKDAKEYRTGLTPASLDITGLADLFVRIFYNENTSLSESFREKTIVNTIEQLASYSGWIVITTNSNSVEDLIFAGRKYQSMSLKVRGRNIAIHPMTQIIQEKNWNDKIAGELGVDGNVQFVVRTGYVRNYPEPVSIRMPVDWFAS